MVMHSNHQMPTDDVEDNQNETVLDVDSPAVDFMVEGDEVVEDVVEYVPFDANLAEYMTEDQLNTLSMEILEGVENDVAARSEWVETFTKGLEMLGFKYEERTEPWSGACGVYSTILSEAVIRFQAEAMSETFPAAGPVKTRILGEENKETKEAAERVRTDMNYELTERMVEYRSEHERMLYSLALAGSAFKKVYFDDMKQRQVSLFVPAEDMVVPYGATNIEDAERVTHITRKTKLELEHAQESGFYLDIPLGEPEGITTELEETKEGTTASAVTDDRYTLYEVHITCTIPGFEADTGLSEVPQPDSDTAYEVEDDSEDGMSEEEELEVEVEFEEEECTPRPYVVTIDKASGKVLAVRRNWDEEDPNYTKNQYFVHYVYVPGFGFYGLGLIHIVGNYAKAGTSIIRQLVDAGTLSNLPGGLKTRGLRLKGEDEPIEPGTFMDVDVPSGTIRDNVMPLPYKEPSATLLALLERITNEGRRLAAISDMNVSDMSANAPVGTTLALLERTLKPMAAVQARVHYAMKQEFKILKRIIGSNSAEYYNYVPYRGDQTSRSRDYNVVEVLPVSDPNSSTMAQRVVQYQTAMLMAKDAPQIYDLPQLHRQMLDVIGIKNAEKIIPLAEDAPPMDPISENMGALVGKPMKAFVHQDHKAHLAAHQAFLADPMIAQTIGQNPQAQQIQAALMAHIAEHLAYSYRTQMEERLGVTLPPPYEPLPPEMEVQLSRAVAIGAQQLTQVHQQQAAQKQAQQIAEDPNMKLREREVAIKEAEQKRKAVKDQTDAQLDAADLALRAKKEKAELGLNAKELALDAVAAARQEQQKNEQPQQPKE